MVVQEEAVFAAGSVSPRIRVLIEAVKKRSFHDLNMTMYYFPNLAACQSDIGTVDVQQNHGCFVRQDVDGQLNTAAEISLNVQI